MSMRDLCTYADFLGVVVLDLVDASDSAGELLQQMNDDVWVHVKIIMKMIIKHIRAVMCAR